MANAQHGGKAEAADKASSDERMMLARHLPKRTVALVLAGGRGSRLHDLTDRRAKPAVYFGGKFRIIDFALSNCINSGIRRIGVLTQYKSHSLLRHLQRGWNFLRGEADEFIDLLPAQQRVDEAYWYRGTADAITQNIDILRAYGPDYILVLAGDHVYKQDYSLMLLDHVESGSRCTVGCIEVPRMEGTALGVMAIDENRWITDFLEKPADPPAMPGKPDRALGSMGIYVFDADYLYELLGHDQGDTGSDHDFGKDIIPRVVREGAALAHPLNMSSVPYGNRDAPYWRDVGTVEAFWAANLDLASDMPELNLYDLQRADFRWLHRAGFRHHRRRAVFRGHGPIALRHRRGRGATRLRHRERLPAAQGGDRPGLRDSGRHGDWRGRAARWQPFLPQRSRRGPGNPGDAGGTGCGTK
jgi:glucose-1-phosphate adenylyltransferase